MVVPVVIGRPAVGEPVSLESSAAATEMGHLDCGGGAGGTGVARSSQPGRQAEAATVGTAAAAVDVVGIVFERVPRT